jgi:hypothetical protein
MTLYGRDGFVAEAPVSTGVPSHPTPLGVFSIIGKSKWHRSNIYSGAPMPFMQRLTWSGIALHAGPLPGYPASHGCIRLPYDFAQRLFGITQVGARVLVIRDPAAPSAIAHDKLFVPRKPEEKPVVVADAAGATKAALTVGTEAGGLAKPEPTIASDEAVGSIGVPPTSDEAVGSIAAAPADEKPAAEPPKGEGPVSVFVSLKQKKVFVRQGFVALFDEPVEIAQPERPIGTHIFTALALNEDSNAMRWSVTSIPSGIRHKAKRVARSRHKGEETNPALLPVSTPAEALDRIAIAPEAVARISVLLMPGSSLIVSDNPISDEVNEHSEFIVHTR